VLKGESPDLPHKTEAGVVRLDIKDIAGLRAAYATIQERAAAHHAALTGVLVQPMVPKGVEIVIGGRADPLFGPLVVVGFGGVLVELLRDTVLAPAPVSAPEAAMLLKRLRGARLLDGFRDLPATDRTRLAEIVSRASVFLADHAARIAELDINPLIAHGAVFRAVDALIVRTRS
jgi:acetyl-CoA synthetase